MTSVTIRQECWDGKLCQQIDAGLLQDVIPPALIETLLETYQMWETRERKLNMVVLVYWLIALHLYPNRSQRDVYAKLASGLRTVRDDVEQQIPVKSAFSYRRRQLGSGLRWGLVSHCARPHPTQQTPGAFSRGMSLLGLHGSAAAGLP